MTKVFSILLPTNTKYLQNYLTFSGAYLLENWEEQYPLQMVSICMV